MDLQTLVDCALTVIFFDNGAENRRYPEPFQDILTSADLDIAFAEAESLSCVNLDNSLDRTVGRLADHSPSTYHELLNVAKAVNKLRESRGIQGVAPFKLLRYLGHTARSGTGYKRKYEELRDQTQQEEQQRAQARRTLETTRREARVTHRSETKTLKDQLHDKIQELSAMQDRCQRRQAPAEDLERTLECRICREKQWDTVTGCGHLFCAGCIKEWLDYSAHWTDEDGHPVEKRDCPVCRKVVLEKDLKRVYIEGH